MQEEKRGPSILRRYNGRGGWPGGRTDGRTDGDDERCRRHRGGGDTWFNSNEEGGRGSTLFKLNRDPFFDALSNIFDHKERGRQFRDSEPGLGWIGAPLLITTGNTCVKRSISSSSALRVRSSPLPMQRPIFSNSVKITVTTTAARESSEGSLHPIRS